MNHNSRCALFDLDGTLVSTGGAGNRALNRACLELFGIPDALDPIDPSGKTDPAIVREIFQFHLHRDPSLAELLQTRDRYLSYLPGECNAAQRYCVMEGIPEILARLQQEKMPLGLGTGNWEEGARIKLERSRLNAFFSFGGYGSDSENRGELLQAGHQKAMAAFGQTILPQNVFVIGDTPRDISAARQAGFKVIAVATGGHDYAELTRHQPDFCFKDFTSVHDVLSALRD